MIDAMDVVVDLRTLERSRHGAFTGAVWLRCRSGGGEESCFPEAGWSDFPVVALAWWLPAVEGVTRLRARTATCRFMDGPYAFGLTALGEPLGRVETRRGRAKLGEFLVHGGQLLASIHAAARAVVSECQRRGWEDDDVKRLRWAIADARTPIPGPGAEAG